LKIDKRFFKQTALFSLFSFELLFLPLREACAQKAIHFESPGDYVEVSHSTSLDPTQFTYELWLRIREPRGFTSDPVQTVLQKRGEVFEASYSLCISDPGFPFSVDPEVGGSGERTSNVIKPGRWNHIAVTQDADSLKTYLFGYQTMSIANSHGGNTTTALRIGGSLDDEGSDWWGLRGDIDELRMWNYARSQQEIVGTMYQTLTGNETGLIAYWDFESISDSTLIDKSPNGDNGIVHGNPEVIDSDAPLDFALHPPLGLRAWGETGTINLAWKPRGTDAISYLVYRDDYAWFFADNTKLIATISAPGSTYTDMSVTEGQDYYYRIRGVDAEQNQSYPGYSARNRVHTVQDDYLTGVFYYPWYGDENDPGGHQLGNGEYVRYYLVPQQAPWVGHYSSRDTLVIRQHLEWMEDYGIDFMACSWWGQEYYDNFSLRDYIAPEMNGSTVRFCIFYETPILGMDAYIFIGPEEEAKLISDFTYFAENFFSHPNYLTIDGRPVVFLYMSNLLEGNYEQAFANVRSELQNLGYDLYLIGDEWGETIPTDDTIAHFQFLDGITSYHMGIWWQGYPIDIDFYAEKSHYAGYWEEACQAEGKVFIPGVNLGFNGNWAGEPFVAIAPREAALGYGETSSYEKNIKVTRPFVDPELKMMMITSWNEWHEDTQIEPTIVTERTNEDVSGQRLYTHGFYYEGYGTAFLEVTRDLLAPGIPVGIDKLPGGSLLPRVFLLTQNYPNPFNPSTTITYDLPAETEVVLRIFNIRGQLVRTLVNEIQPAETYQVTWDGRDSRGVPVPSGVYLYRLMAGTESKTRKMVILK